MNILIYDDCKEDIINLKSVIENYFSDKNIVYTVYVCESTEYLLTNVNRYDLIFLDMRINDENGIDIGMKIRARNKNTHIIIISNYTEYLIQGYKIEADRYLLKPITQSIFNIEFDNVVNRFFQDAEYFYDEKMYIDKIFYKEVLYIEFKDRKSHIHLLNGTIIDTPYTLMHWEEVCSGYLFGKCHKSYLLNLRHISGFNKTDIILINNERIPLSRHYKKDFNKVYGDYLQGGM